MLEAMAAGCPALTSNRWGPKEIAQDAATFVDPESVESIAAALERLLSDEQYRHTLISAGTARAAQFRWDTAARAVLSVLERIARAEGRRTFRKPRQPE